MLLAYSDLVSIRLGETPIKPVLQNCQGSNKLPSPQPLLISTSALALLLAKTIICVLPLGTTDFRHFAFNLSSQRLTKVLWLQGMSTNEDFGHHILALPLLAEVEVDLAPKTGSLVPSCGLKCLENLSFAMKD